MNQAVNESMPRARKDGLVVREMAGELLVYDRQTNKAHSLNQTAALIWKRCDGNSTIADLRFALEEVAKTTVDEPVVWYALGMLAKNSLLEEPLKPLGHARR